MIWAIGHEIKNKLVLKAIDKYDLLGKSMKTEVNICSSAPVGPGCDDNILIKDYREAPTSFDQMVYTIWRYFELMNSKSNQFEDLWLNICESLELPQPTKFTVFKEAHH